MNDAKEIYLSQLDKVQVLWPGDVRALADFCLRACAEVDRRENVARNDDTIQISGPTLNGFAGMFATVAHIPKEEVERVFEAHGLYMGLELKCDPATEKELA